MYKCIRVGNITNYYTWIFKQLKEHNIIIIITCWDENSFGWCEMQAGNGHARAARCLSYLQCKT